MGVQMLRVVCSSVIVCALLVLQGSAGYSLTPSPSALPAVPPDGEGAPGRVAHGNEFKSIAPTPAVQPNGTNLPPTLVLPPPTPAPVPSRVKAPVPSLQPITPTISPPHSSVGSPGPSQGNPSDSPHSSGPPPLVSAGNVPASPPNATQRKPPDMGHPIFVPEAPGAAPVLSPSTKAPQSPPDTQVPGPMPRSFHGKNTPDNKAPPPVTIAPVVDAPAPRQMPTISPPTPLVMPEVPPSIPPDPTSLSPSKLPGISPPFRPKLPKEPPSSSPVSAPAPRIDGKRIGAPLAAPPNRTRDMQSPVYPSPTRAPGHKAPGQSHDAPPPLPLPEPPSANGVHSPASLPSNSFQRRHHFRANTTVPAPSHTPPPRASTEQGWLVPPAPSHPESTAKTNLTHHLPPPISSGFPQSPQFPPLPPSKSHGSPAISPPALTEDPFLSPKVSPSGSSPRKPSMPPRPIFPALPPPPPNEDCASFTCKDPFTNSPPGSPCACVLPMQVGLRLSVELYTFFPLVSELAAEIAGGVFMKQSQVRIMGANAASEDPEKTIALIDLVPLGEKFDNTTAYLTFQRFWHKEVDIKASFFGDYDVLYVRYPGLPPSPPSAPSDIGIAGGPYPGSDNGRTIKPLGVDIRKKQHKDGPNASVTAIIVLSASVAVILCCAVAWVFLFKNRDRTCQSEQTPPTTMASLAKSSGIAASMLGSGPTSTSMSFGSSIAALAGSAKTFSLSDIERATGNFDESKVLGEGGFGRVYSGVLDDGTNVAVKILKRDDQQGSREFLAEIEMLSRLHHRNLVKLIGICTEEHARCLVYELVPNGSVESHLHGVDKETAPLDWCARMKIALGAARGLAYLHEDSSPRVIHRDFKSSNILLEHDFTPKVSDFGLARTALDEENRHISTRVMGTFGYVAPEYAMTGHLLVKSDVYSYGVVLLELLTGRKPVDMSQPPGQENLVSWARPLLTTREALESAVDPALGPDFPMDSIAKVAAIASMCVQPEVSHRPFMGEVVQALKLVCNECDETKELGSRSCSQEDLSIDMHAGVVNSSGSFQIALEAQSPVSDYESVLDVERGLSTSELLSTSARYGRQESGSFRRHSSSGPLITGNARRLWKKMRRLSGGSVSEHGVTFRLWPESH